MKAILVAVFACGVAGCMAEDPAPTDTAGQPADPGAQQVQSQADDPPVNRSVQDTTTPDDLDSASGVVALAQDCVFIQWCDQPNSTNGTVCIVRSSCRNQCVGGVTSAVINECNQDAQAVCGGITQQARIFCQ